MPEAHLPGTGTSGRRARSVALLGPLLTTALVTALAGCGSGGSAGPADPSDGTYRLYATSAGTVDAETAPLLELAGDTLRLADGDQAATLGEPAEQLTLCPPSGEGAPVRLDTALTVGDLVLTSPALFGDCGTTAPERVTVVDLDAIDTDLAFPFERWAEFCDVDDPDC